MQPTIFSVVSQRLITRIDDRAIELHPLVNVVNDMISPLAQLKLHPSFRARRFEIKSQRIGLPDAAGAGEDLSRR